MSDPTWSMVARPFGASHHADRDEATWRWPDGAGWEQEMIDAKSHLEPESVPETYRVLMIGHFFGCGVRSITFFERINFILPSSLPKRRSRQALK
jgi:hypothetical protein